MPKKRFGAEQIVTLLHQIEVLMAQGKALDYGGLIQKSGDTDLTTAAVLFTQFISSTWCFVRPTVMIKS